MRATTTLSAGCSRMVSGAMLVPPKKALGRTAAANRARINAGADQRAQRALSFVLAQRGALARGAEHGNARATVGPRLASVRDQARQVDRPVFGEGRGEGDGKIEAIGAERQVRFP